MEEMSGSPPVYKGTRWFPRVKRGDSKSSWLSGWLPGVDKKCECPVNIQQIQMQLATRFNTHRHRHRYRYHSLASHQPPLEI
jgi:hypothetical protein